MSFGGSPLKPIFSRWKEQCKIYKREQIDGVWILFHPEINIVLCTVDDGNDLKFYIIAMHMNFIWSCNILFYITIFFYVIFFLFSVLICILSSRPLGDSTLNWKSIQNQCIHLHSSIQNQLKKRLAPCLARLTWLDLKNIYLHILQKLLFEGCYFFHAASTFSVKFPG